MRLTLINQFYAPELAPTAQLAASLARHRASRGDEVTVVTSAGGYVPEATGAWTPTANPHVIRLWTPGLGKATLLGRLLDYAAFYKLAALRVLTLRRQDVIISMTTPPFIAWAGALHKALHRSTRLVLWNMDCYPDAAERTGVIRAGGAVSRLLRGLNAALFQRLDRLVCLDRAMLRLLVSEYVASARPVETALIPNWEEAAEFPPDLVPAPWRAVEALGLAGKFVVLYLGNAGYGHRFESVIEAAQLLRDEPVVFLFVGGGEKWAWIEQAKTRYGLANVCIHGYVPKAETPSVMAAADCALVTLTDEALGLISPSKLHANLAMGLPVIYVGPEGSNVDDALQRFACGASLRHGDASGLADFIRKMMQDSQALRGLRRQARRAFEQAYSDSQGLASFDSLLDALAPPPDPIRPG